MSGMQGADYDRMKELADSANKQIKLIESCLQSLESARKDMADNWTGFSGVYYSNLLYRAIDKAQDSLAIMKERADELKRAGERHELADIEAKKVSELIEPAVWVEV